MFGHVRTFASLVALVLMTACFGIQPVRADTLRLICTVNFPERGGRIGTNYDEFDIDTTARIISAWYIGTASFSGPTAREGPPPPITLKNWPSGNPNDTVTVQQFDDHTIKFEEYVPPPPSPPAPAGLLPLTREVQIDRYTGAISEIVDRGEGSAEHDGYGTCSAATGQKF